jgi:hypothetical protein
MQFHRLSFFYLNQMANLGNHSTQGWRIHMLNGLV